MMETYSSIITATSSNVPNPTIAIWKHNHHKPKGGQTAAKKSDLTEQGLFGILNVAFTVAPHLLLTCILTVILMDAMVGVI